MEKKPEIQKVYNLSPMQEGMLFHSLLNPDTNAYNVQASFTATGIVNVDLLEKSLNLLIERHEILRTVFIFENIKKPKQVVIKERQGAIYFENLAHSTDEEKTKYVDEYLKRDRETPIKLSKDLLIRVSVFKLDDALYKIIITHHHIILDGWCFSIIIRELFQIYKALNNKTTPRLDKAQPYEDYIKWLDRLDKEEALVYWEQYLKGYGQHAAFIQSAEKVDKRYEYAEYMEVIDEARVECLTNIARHNNVTLNTIIETIWGLLLQKFNNCSDIVFGSVVSGRPSELQGIEGIVGLFINTIPKRIKSDGNVSFVDLVKNIQASSLLSEKYSYFQLADIQARTEMKTNLIDHVIVFENYPVEKEVNALIRGDAVYGFSVSEPQMYVMTNYDLNVIFVPGKTLEVRFTYNSSVYSEEFLKVISGYFANIISDITRNPEILVRDICILSDTQKNRMVYQFNTTNAAYPTHKTVYELFEEQAERTPCDIIALWGEKQLTYNELDLQSNRLAHYLRRRGVSKGTIVGFMVEHSFDILIGIMGILKAGGAYLPIDSQYPVERKNFLLSDSGVNILLTQSNMIDSIGFEGEIIYMDDPGILQEEDTQLKHINSRDDLAYVIYTSGSTGKPKGVMVKHSGLTNYICWAAKVYLQGKKLVFPLYSSISFDLTVTSVFAPMVTGGSVVIYSNTDRLSIIRQILEEDRVDIMKLTPTHLQAINEFGCVPSKLCRFIVGGEELSTELARKIHDAYKGRVEIFNEYGPTETVVGCMIHKFNPDADTRASVPIGRPADNVQIYLLDEYLHPIPFEGGPGEIYISGDGVSDGYLNRPELTKERFVQNPFIPKTVMYKTGDFGRWLHSSSQIEFCGRKDHQVKLRGYRIELGEIETCLLKHQKVHESVVLVHDDKGSSPYLCAYIICDDELSVSDLREYLLEELPHYMVPALFIKVERFPLTENGKLDVKLLMHQNIAMDTGIMYENADNQVEKALLEVWAEHLNIQPSRIGMNDNFFDIGGNSILLIRVQVQIEKLFPGKVKIADLFTYPTIRSLAKYISGKKAIALATVKLPEDFFTNGRVVDVASHLSFIIKGEVLRKIKGLSVKLNASVGQIFLTLYAYLFLDLLNRQEVIIQSITLDNRRSYPVKVSLEQVVHIHDLVCQVALYMEEDKEYYLIGDLETAEMKRDVYSVLPGFYYGNMDGVEADKLLNIFGIILHVNMSADSVNLTFYFDKTHLGYKKIREFALKYIKAIEVIPE